MAQGLHGAFGTEVAAADADGDHQVHTLALPAVTHRLAVRNEAFRRFGRQVLPTEEIIAGTVSGDERVECSEGLAHILLVLGLVHEAAATFDVNFYHSVSISFKNAQS